MGGVSSIAMRLSPRAPILANLVSNSRRNTLQIFAGFTVLIDPLGVRSSACVRQERKRWGNGTRNACVKRGMLNALEDEVGYGFRAVLSMPTEQSEL